MIKVYASIPDEILGGNLTEFWNRYERKLRQEFHKDIILSNYTGEGTLEEADVVVFLYEYKDSESCKRDMQRCKDLGKQYNFFTKFYAPDRLYYSD